MNDCERVSVKLHGFEQSTLALALRKTTVYGAPKSVGNRRIELTYHPLRQKARHSLSLLCPIVKRLKWYSQGWRFQRFSSRLQNLLVLLNNLARESRPTA